MFPVVVTGSVKELGESFKETIGLFTLMFPLEVTGSGKEFRESFKETTGLNASTGLESWENTSSLA